MLNASLGAPAAGMMRGFAAIGNVVGGSSKGAVEAVEETWPEYVGAIDHPKYNGGAQLHLKGDQLIVRRPKVAHACIHTNYVPIAWGTVRNWRCRWG
eukprot:3265556-Rhodomonas_salina.2